MRAQAGRSRAGLAVLGSVLIAAGTVSPVLAAAPANDDSTNARVVTAIPFSDGPYDTTEATSGAEDPLFCYGGDLGDRATVWYSFTATDSARLQADTFGSDYDTTLYVGTPNGLGGIDVISCNDDAFDLQSAVRWDAVAGTTYLFVVGTCCGGAGEPGGGGNTVFNLDVAPPPPTISLSIDPIGSFASSHVSISGTLTCTGIPVASMDLQVSQRVGRFTIAGAGYVEVACTGSPEPWSTDVYPFSGTFSGGRAQVAGQAYGCGVDECAYETVTATVRLRR